MSLNKELLENSIECTVHYQGSYFIDETWDEMDKILRKLGTKEGDKVRLIVIKNALYNNLKKL